MKDSSSEEIIGMLRREWLTVGYIISNFLTKGIADNVEVQLQIAQRCCECMGFPGECESAEEVLESLAWIDSPRWNPDNFTKIVVTEASRFNNQANPT